MILHIAVNYGKNRWCRLVDLDFESASLFMYVIEWVSE